jgi:hypothetical protein
VSWANVTCQTYGWEYFTNHYETAWFRRPRLVLPPAPGSAARAWFRRPLNCLFPLILLMFSRVCPSHAGEFPVTLGMARIECPDLPDEWSHTDPAGRGYDTKVVGNALVILATGPGVLNADGSAKPVSVTLRVTPLNGWKWKDSGSAEARNKPFIHKQGAQPQTSFEFERDEVPADVDVYVVPARLEEIHFNNGFGNLLSDKGEEYAAPQWKDNDFDGLIATGDVEAGDNGHNFPLAFVKDSKAKFNAICRLGNPLPFELKLQLSSMSVESGFGVQPKELQEAPGKPLTLQTGEVETNTAFGNEITLYCDIPPANEGFFIHWKLGFAGQAPIPLQRTVHTLYLTAKSPVQPMAHGLRESLFFYACDANAGQESTDARVLLEAIHWKFFATKEMRAVVPGLAKIDGDSDVFEFTMKEPKVKKGEEHIDHSYIPYGKRNVCGAWAEFMRDTAWVHGAGEVQVAGVVVNLDANVPGPKGNYKISNWYVPPRTVTQGDNPPQPENPTPDGGQGNGHTRAEWDSHVLVGFLDGQTATGPFYDPSYGTPKKNPGAAADVFNTLEDYARLAAAGFHGQLVDDGETHEYFWKEEHFGAAVQELKIDPHFAVQPLPPQPEP